MELEKYRRKYAIAIQGLNASRELENSKIAKSTLLEIQKVKGQDTSTEND